MTGETQSERSSPTPGVAFCIPTPHIPQRWPAIEWIVKQAEAWTQTIGATEVREQLCNGNMQAWGVLDRAQELCMALTRFTDTSRGMIYTAWVYLPVSVDDDAAMAALLRLVQDYGRSRGAIALEIIVAPWAAPKLERCVAQAKTTAVALEIDLRIARMN